MKALKNFHADGVEGIKGQEIKLSDFKKISPEAQAELIAEGCIEGSEDGQSKEGAKADKAPKGDKA